MTAFDKYVLVLCVVVYIVLATAFSVLIGYIVRHAVRTIRGGLEDESIQKEYAKARRHPHACLERLLCWLIGVAVLAGFAGSMYLYAVGDRAPTLFPTLHVVRSGSMAEKHEANRYLTEKDLNDQIGKFDLIVAEPLPDESELALYDVVIYDLDGTSIVHRIVGIEEPNELHPNERRFLLRGDANRDSDREYVSYSQIKAIYRGSRIPFLGHFVTFMQSPAGWLCAMLIVFSMVASYVAEQKIRRARECRYRLISAGGAVGCVASAVHVTPFPLTRSRFTIALQDKRPQATCRYEAGHIGVQVNVDRSALLRSARYAKGNAPSGKRGGERK